MSYGIWYATAPALREGRARGFRDARVKNKQGRSAGTRMKDSATANNGARPAGGRAIHPGSGRRKAAPFPRGRVLREAEVAAVKAILGERPRERALLIEYLHLIQDKEGCLPSGLLHALAEELKVPMAE